VVVVAVGDFAGSAKTLGTEAAVAAGVAGKLLLTLGRVLEIATDGLLATGMFIGVLGISAGGAATFVPMVVHPPFTAVIVVGCVAVAPAVGFVFHGDDGVEPVAAAGEVVAAGAVVQGDDTPPDAGAFPLKALLSDCCAALTPALKPSRTAAPELESASCARCVAEAAAGGGLDVP
jgi:hypothetical protein